MKTCETTFIAAPYHIYLYKWYKELFFFKPHLEYSVHTVVLPVFTHDEATWSPKKKQKKLEIFALSFLKFCNFVPALVICNFYLLGVGIVDDSLHRLT